MGITRIITYTSLTITGISLSGLIVPNVPEIILIMQEKYYDQSLMDYTAAIATELNKTDETDK